MIEAREREIIELLQSGLPLVEKPFEAVANSLGKTEREVIDILNEMKKRGLIRRIGAAPNHFKLGIVANGMTVWDVDDFVVDKLGEKVGNLSFVSHSYRRPRIPKIWPYNLFAMVHGKCSDEVYEKMESVAKILGDSCRRSDVLFSKRILKKTGVRLRKNRE